MTNKTVAIRIDSCKQCPHFHSEKYYTADSWDDCVEWTCKEAERSIAILDWNDKNPAIPKWCPLRGS